MGWTACRHDAANGERPLNFLGANLGVATEKYVLARAVQRVAEQPGNGQGQRLAWEHSGVRCAENECQHDGVLALGPSGGVACARKAAVFLLKIPINEWGARPKIPQTSGGQSAGT